MIGEMKAGRCASVETTSIAKFENPTKNHKPHHILPKVSEWTDRKREYHQNWLSLRLSLRLLRPGVKPFSEQHKAVYQQLCLELDTCIIKLMWAIWEQGKNTNKR